MDNENLRFTNEHEWVRVADEGNEVTIGITDFAAGELGDIVYVELPDVGKQLAAGDAMGTIEAVKTVADLYAPISGAVTAVNGSIQDHPELVNGSPYGDGWFVRMRPSEPGQMEGLLTHDAYRKLIGDA
jgi:glycine cleavage system H protein